MMKYTINTFLAYKVHFFNEINNVCEKMHLDYDTLLELVLLDKRISPSHTAVPGPDGKFGFGGSCLVKETKGMVALRESLSLNNLSTIKMLYDNSLNRLKDRTDLRSSFLCYIIKKYSSVSEDTKNTCIFPQDKFEFDLYPDVFSLNFSREELVSIGVYDKIYNFTSESDTTIYFRYNEDDWLEIENNVVTFCKKNTMKYSRNM
jgi:hypothetical protein